MGEPEENILIKKYFYHWFLVATVLDLLMLAYIAYHLR